MILHNAICVVCKEPFQRKLSARNEGKAPICSRRCTGLYARSKRPAPGTTHTTVSAAAATAKPRFT